MPHPEVLARYADADPTFPERIVRMAEVSADAETRNALRESAAASFAVKWGMIGTIALSLLSVLTAVLLAVVGIDNWWTILALPLFTAVPRIITAARRPSMDEPDE